MEMRDFVGLTKNEKRRSLAKVAVLQLKKIPQSEHEKFESHFPSEDIPFLKNKGFGEEEWDKMERFYEGRTRESIGEHFFRNIFAIMLNVAYNGRFQPYCRTVYVRDRIALTHLKVTHETHFEKYSLTLFNNNLF